MTEQDKQAMLEVARAVIASEFEGGAFDATSIEHLDRPQGVFVTLTIGGQLRGCIGLPLPVKPLKEALVSAAYDAAFSDPRFLPLSNAEFEHVELEINVLTEPVLMEVDDAEDYFELVEVGVDGLLIRGNYNSGLLLPSVAERYGWSVDEYLNAICEKAGMPVDAWENLDNKLFKFQSIEFSE